MKNLEDKKALVIGICNDARQDDGLGWALLSKIEKIIEKLDFHNKCNINQYSKKDKEDI